jgi:hypothetical protein
MSRESNMEDAMSFREKAAWVSLLSMLAIWGIYALKALPVLAPATHGTLADGAWIASLTIRAVVVTTIVQAVLIGVLAARAPGEAQLHDEREAAFDARATRHGFVMLNAAVFGVAIIPAFLPFAKAALAMVVALLLAMALAEVTRAASLIGQFRRGS